MSNTATLTLGSNDHSEPHALMYSFFKVQPRSKPDDQSTVAHPEHLTSSNCGNFYSNGLQNSLQVQQSSLDTEPDISESYDPSGDRRKRRKVSTEPEDHVSGHKQWNLLPPPRIVETRPRDPIQQRLGLPEEKSADLDSPRKRRGRPSKSSQLNGSTQGDTSSAQIQDVSEETRGEALPTKSHKHADSPRKKSMRLTAKGTLLSSPRSSQEAKTTITAGSPTSKVKKGSSSLTLKNGKFIQCLTVRLRYQNVGVTGKKIDEILSTQPSTTPAANVPSLSGKVQKAPKKITHPFFLGKTAPRLPQQDPSASEIDAKAQESHDEDGQKTVPWKDIVFKTKKTPFSKALQKPAWPPHALQHIGRDVPNGSSQNDYVITRNKQKAKAVMNRITIDENILARYTETLLTNASSTSRCVPCQMLQYTSRELLDRLVVDVGVSAESLPILYAREKVLASPSPFDRGQAPGPLPWCQKYGPARWQEVLQPDSQQLHDWLRGLAIHQVQSSTEKGSTKLLAKRKKKAKKRDDELNDFIVNDDDDLVGSRMKNSILLVGPNGCGKTASVFAVAKQLGFEVFEIHPGMRRSQKDILDKVGDMAQNHLVQGGGTSRQDSSIIPEIESNNDHDASKQRSIGTLISKSSNKSSRSATPQPAKEQKQSLILFEEVDNVFEDDRGFWSAVQALIQTSKRPVILTCNSLQGIPLDELEPFTVLTYSPPPADVVSKYLCCVAAAEGHLIQPVAVKNLYISKNHDLRATMMELDLWCQMTVGSNKGGLDWIPHFDRDISIRADRPRVISKDTFAEGMHLLPTPCMDLAETLTFLYQTSEIPLSRWFDCAGRTFNDPYIASTSSMIDFAENCSDADLLDEPTQAFMAASMWPVQERKLTDLRDIAHRYCAEPAATHYDNAGILLEALQPLNSERPVFPPAQGRLAPSLDEPKKTIATDLAPYVRSIAAYDLGLEAYREELSSSQGRKTRTTRAARAAVEGGDKGSTRPQKWLPANLDLRAVMATGGNWPRWTQKAAVLQAISAISTPHSDEGQLDQPESNEYIDPVVESY